MTGRRTYDPNLDDVFVNRDGTIRWGGEQIGTVYKLPSDSSVPTDWRWRAEIGDPSADGWPPYRAVYARTKKAAVAEVLDGVEVPK